MPFIDPPDMKTAEPLPGWKGRFWRSDHIANLEHIVFAASRPGGRSRARSERVERMA